MAGLVGVVGSRALPASWSSRGASVVRDLVGRGCGVASGGALGADQFALQAVVASGACSSSSVFLPGLVTQAPASCRSALSAFTAAGGSLVAGSAAPRCSRREFISALFARSLAMVQACTGVVAFVAGRSSGTWFTCQAAARLGRPVVVFPVEGGRVLRSLGCGSWVRLAAWPGAFRWVPSAQPGCRCRHGIQVEHCSGLPVRRAA